MTMLKVCSCLYHALFLCVSAREYDTCVFVKVVAFFSLVKRRSEFSGRGCLCVI